MPRVLKYISVTKHGIFVKTCLKYFLLLTSFSLSGLLRFEIILRKTGFSSKMSSLGRCHFKKVIAPSDICSNNFDQLKCRKGR